MRAALNLRRKQIWRWVKINMENPCIGTESLQEKNELLKDQILCFRFLLSGSIMNPKYNKVKTSTTAICTHSRRVYKRAHSVTHKHRNMEIWARWIPLKIMNSWIKELIGTETSTILHQTCKSILVKFISVLEYIWKQMNKGLNKNKIKFK